MGLAGVNFFKSFNYCFYAHKKQLKYSTVLTFKPLPLFTRLTRKFKSKTLLLNYLLLKVKQILFE